MRPRGVIEWNKRNKERAEREEVDKTNISLPTSETMYEPSEDISSSDSSEEEEKFVVLRKSRMTRAQRRIKKHSGYYYFMIDAHSQIRETDPHIPFIDRCHLINEMWRELDVQEKRSYDEIAQQIYIRELAEKYVKSNFI